MQKVTKLFLDLVDKHYTLMMRKKCMTYLLLSKT